MKYIKNKYRNNSTDDPRFRIPSSDMKPNIDQGGSRICLGGYRASDTMRIWGHPPYSFDPKCTNTDILLFLSHLDYKSTIIYFTIYSFLDRKWYVTDVRVTDEN